MPEYLEGFGSAPAFTEYRAFKKTGGGIKINGLNIGQVRGGLYREHIFRLMIVLLAFDRQKMEWGIRMMLFHLFEITGIVICFF